MKLFTILAFNCLLHRQWKLFASCFIYAICGPIYVQIKEWLDYLILQSIPQPLFSTVGSTVLTHVFFQNCGLEYKEKQKSEHWAPAKKNTPSWVNPLPSWSLGTFNKLINFSVLLPEHFCCPRSPCPPKLCLPPVSAAWQATSLSHGCHCCLLCRNTALQQN
jgi:hypothetical protein